MAFAVPCETPQPLHSAFALPDRSRAELLWISIDVQATVLLLVWPKRRRPLIRGASRSDVEEAFPDWEITHVEPSHFRLPRPMALLLRPDEHWYRLRRASA